MPTTIKDLPPELMVKIFSHYVKSVGQKEFLINIPLVCRNWNDLSSAAPIWRNVRLRDWNYLLNLSQRGLLHHTRILEVNCYDGSYSDEILSHVLENIRDLKALALACDTDAITLVTEHCPPHLERLCLTIMEHSGATSQNLDRLLTVCGPTLKDLDLRYFVSEEEPRQQQLLSGTTAKCSLLERLEFYRVCVPIYELQSGCPRLKELEITRCQLITTGKNDFSSSSACGFKDLKKFTARWSDFGGLDMYALLKFSVDLEHLELFINSNLVFGRVSKIPSDKVNILDVTLKDPNENLKALGDAVWKWRSTLSVLNLRFWKCNAISCVLERFLHDNPNPQLKSLAIQDDIDPHFLEDFIEKCQNLIHLKLGCKDFKGRGKIEESFGISLGKTTKLFGVTIRPASIILTFGAALFVILTLMVVGLITFSGYKAI